MTFAAGDLVLLVDRRDRRYLITLTEGREFHSHVGPIPHDADRGARLVPTDGNGLGHVVPPGLES